MSDPMALVKEVSAAIDESKDSIKALDTQLNDFMASAKSDNENVVKLSNDALKAANDTAEKISSISDQIIDIEQKIADNVQSGKAAPKTLGSLVIKSEAFKQFANRDTKAMRIESDSIQMNTITGQDGGSPPRNSDTLVAADRLAGIVPGAFRTLRLEDVLPSGTTSSNAVEYTRELAFTNSAAETAEGDTKPESALTFELKTANVRTIAHWLKASVQIIDDAPALESYINARLAYGVRLRTENQLLTGDGTSQNIEGLLVGDNYTSFSPTAGETALDSLNRMKYLVAGSDYEASAIILNPTDWGEIERLKGTDDHYVIGNPVSPIGPMLWSLPVIVTNAMTAGKAHVSSIEILAQVFTRSGVAVEMFEQDDTNVQKNLLTIRGEARKALAVYTPAASRFGALTSPGASA